MVCRSEYEEALVGGEKSGIAHLIFGFESYSSSASACLGDLLNPFPSNVDKVKVL
jgi:hypothetical protein